MKTVKLTKEQCNIMVTALGYYRDLIFNEDLKGAAKNLVTIQHIIDEITK